MIVDGFFERLLCEIIIMKWQQCKSTFYPDSNYFCWQDCYALQIHLPNQHHTRARFFCLLSMPVAHSNIEMVILMIRR